MQISNPDKRRFTVDRIGAVPLPVGAVRDGVVADPVTVGAAIRQLWHEQKIGSKHVALGVGGKRVLVRDMVVPESAMTTLATSLPGLVQENLPVPVTEAILDFYAIREVNNQSGRGYQGLLVAALKDAIKANIEATRLAGLKVDSVDLNAFAVARAGARGEFSKQTTAFVDLGASSTTVVITSLGVPLYVRHLTVGGAAITDSIVEKLKVGPEEAERLKREVGIGRADRPDQQPVAEAVLSVVQPLTVNLRDTLSYYNQQHPDDPLRAVVLAGGGSHLAGFKEALAESFRIPVTQADALLDANLAKSVDSSAARAARAELVTAVGLAGGKH